MNEARPYASLSSGLLARKGTAKPAMRPQNYGSLEDLGWNDMGGAPGQENTPAPPAEHVPSSISALTPAPKIQRTNPTDAHLPPESFADDEGEESFQAGEGSEAEAVPADEFQAPADDFQPPEAFEAEQPLEAEEALQPEESWRADEPYQPEPVAEEPVAEEYLAEAAAPEAFDELPEIVTPSVVAQQRAILERFDGAEDLRAVAARSADARAEIVPLPQRVVSGGLRKAAFTLRLDAERHLRLRLACAVTRHSAQQIVARALAEALAGIPEIEALASQVAAKPGRAGKRN
jgi:hypothetical protein